MKYRKHILSIILGVVVLPLCSCDSLFFSGSLSANTKWESSDGKFTIFVQGISTYMNFGEIEINGVVETVLYYNPSNSHIASLKIIRDGDNDEHSMTFTLNRIKTDGFYTFLKDTFNGAVTYNTTGDSYWDDWEGTFSVTSLAESELDAKYYYCTTFENDDLDIMFGLENYPQDAFEYKLNGHYGDDQIEFSFGDNKEFTITDGGNNTASGTYISRYDGMDLLFTTNGIFDIDGNTIALESTNTMNFI
ncbi:MAG: hypothetical protein WC201_02570, partial [Bacilli bacterium]